MRYIKLQDSIDAPQVFIDVYPERTSLKQKPSAITYALKKGLINKDTINLDLGGGRFDLGTELVQQAGAVNLLIDPYARTKEHNFQTLKTLNNYDGVDTVTLSSVLNVIPDVLQRTNVLEQAFEAVKENGTLIVSIYEGDRTGVGSISSRNTFQANLSTRNYLELVQSIFGNAKRVGRIIVAVKNETVV